MFISLSSSTLSYEGIECVITGTTQTSKVDPALSYLAARTLSKFELYCPNPSDRERIKRNFGDTYELFGDSDTTTLIKLDGAIREDSSGTWGGLIFKIV